MILNCQDWLDNVQSMKKMSQDNNITNRIGSPNAKNEIELSLLI